MRYYVLGSCSYERFIMDRKNLAVIAAISQDGVFARNGTLPWDSKKDLLHFRELTLGCSLVMGRGTWDSLPDANKPLPGRENIVLSRSLEGLSSDVKVVATLGEAIEVATCQKIFFIGGHDVWFEALQKFPVDNVYLSTIVSYDKETGAQVVLFPEPGGSIYLALFLSSFASIFPKFSLVSERIESDVDRRTGSPLSITFSHWGRVG